MHAYLCKKKKEKKPKANKLSYTNLASIQLMALKRPNRTKITVVWKRRTRMAHSSLSGQEKQAEGIHRWVAN